MHIVPTGLEGVVIIEPRIVGDARGYFMEAYVAHAWGEVCPAPFVQENESHSVRGVVRGLHFQRAPHAQGKLVRVVRGRVLDVAVDIRVGSPTFGQHVAVELSEDNHRQLFVPRGFAHGFSVLSPEATFLYKCDAYYAPESEGSVAWDDPQLAIDWGVPHHEVVLSAKDRLARPLAEQTHLFDYSDPLY